MENFERIVKSGEKAGGVDEFKQILSLIENIKYSDSGKNFGDKSQDFYLNLAKEILPGIKNPDIKKLLEEAIQESIK